MEATRMKVLGVISTTAVFLLLGATVPAHTYAGSSLAASVEVGSQRILSILPGIGKLVGA